MITMIRNIINFFVIAALFFLGNKYYPEYIYAQDTKTLIIATITMFVIGIVAGLLVIALFIALPPIGCLSVIALIFIVPIQLALTSYYIDGFEVNGFWTYVFLWFVISICTVRVKVNTENK
jgi:hypothetical protein